MTYFTTGAVVGSSFYPQNRPDLLQPLVTERPVIRVPRSAKRNYTDEELATAAAMLKKLRCRQDVVKHVQTLPMPVADHVIDVVMERLLKVI